MPGRVDIAGQRFGRLVAIRDIGTKYRRRLWLCQCDCGKTTEVIAGVLRIGKTKSCGCLNLEPTRILPPGIAAFNELFTGYKRNASKGGREFDLTREVFKRLTSSNCYYCGATPEQKIQRENTNGAYIYNGVDRVDSKKGYSIFNCVPCCKQCNYAKHNFSEEEFYGWVKRVHEHIMGGSLCPVSL